MPLNVAYVGISLGFGAQPGS